MHSKPERILFKNVLQAVSKIIMPNFEANAYKFQAYENRASLPFGFFLFNPCA